MTTPYRRGTDVQPRSRTGKLLRVAAWLALILLVLAGPNIVFYFKWMHPDESIPPVDDRIDQLASTEATAALGFGTILHEARAGAGLPSMSGAIGYGGTVQWAGAVGYSDIESRTPATLRSRYRLGSTSKALTGVLLARLVDAGQVDVDAPISSQVQGMPAHLAPLTARQLVSHSGGVRHYSMPAWWLGWWEMYSNQPFNSVDEGLSLFRDDKLLFTPGEGFNYSTFGYSLLSRLMEGASGMDFPRLLEEQLFMPADMQDSDVDRAGEMPRRVSFYSADSGRFTPDYPTDSSYKIAGGGMVSTPVDLVRLGIRLLGSGFVSDAGKQLLWTPMLLSDGAPNPQNYAAGWRIDTSERLLGAGDPTLIFHHGGTQAGGAAFFMLVPEYDMAVAVVSNSGTGTARSAVQETAYELVRRALASKQVASPHD
ncbi:serine hydrolase domain-containing protein [Luteimonas changyuni]|uniref:serine hydrolase domain-containing protein n=1 Tax=Luteimonas sp. MJ145 TaxID=3129234 RepID=UPI0031BB571F